MGYRTLIRVIACRLTSTETLGLIFNDILMEIKTFSLKNFSAQRRTRQSISPKFGGSDYGALYAQVDSNAWSPFY